jgi:hypothetical protein
MAASDPPPAPGASGIDKKLCRVGGLNQNYVSASGTPCHMQIEDLGPVVDRGSEEAVRRVNVIVYVNYGTAASRIIFGRDFDYPDVRTSDYNQVIKEQMSQLVTQAQAIVEQMEERELAVIRASLASRRDLPPEKLREQFRECAALYPSLFKRAVAELRAEEASATFAADIAAAEAAKQPVPAAALPELGVAREETVYPMDAEMRRRVIEIESLITKMGQDVLRLKAYGLADDILLQRYRKLVDQARDSISRGGGLQARRLDVTLDNLTKTWRQVRSLLHGRQ